MEGDNKVRKTEKGGENTEECEKEIKDRIAKKKSRYICILKNLISF